MSTEATGNGKSDAGGQTEQEPAASESSGTAEVLMADKGTDEVDETVGEADETVGEADEAAGPATDDEAAQVYEDEAGRNDEDEAARGDEDEEREQDGEYGEYAEAGEEGEYGEFAADDDEHASDAYAPSELIEFAEAVEFDEPATPGRPARRWTRVLVALGFLIVAAAIVGGAVAIVGSVTHGFKKPVKVTYKKSAVFSLKTGDCFNPAGTSYTLVSCDAPHETEVFGTFTLAGGKWPGNTAVAAAASNGCATRLSGYLNPQLAISLASTYVYPDATAWQAGTRTVICEVRAENGEITGSVRGASATAG
jgi:Septum formation